MTTIDGVHPITEMKTAAVRGETTFDKIGETIGEYLGEVARTLAGNGIQPAGPPYALYHKVDGNDIDIEVGMPIDTELKETERVRQGRLMGGQAASAWHLGHYDTLSDSWKTLERWVTEQGFEGAGPCWELYWTDPRMKPNPDEWRTEIVWPVRPRASEAT